MLSRANSGEYYPSFINTPGCIKYDFQEDFFTSLHFHDVERPNDLTTIEEITPEILRRCIPHTRRQFLDYMVILILKSELLNGEIWYKIALQNPTDKTIAIITTTNSIDNLTIHGNRGTPTLQGKWFMGRYRTTAPLYFWFEIQKRLLTNMLERSLTEVF
jgi:hypothetical protein